MLRNATGLASSSWENAPERELTLDDASQSLLRELSRDAYMFAYRMTADAALSEHLTEKTLLATMRKDPEAAWPEYVTRSFRSLTRACIDAEGGLWGRWSKNGNGSTTGGNGVPKRVDLAIRSLRPRDRAALLLSRMSGFDRSRVATCLGESSAKAGDRVSRATLQLVDDLRDVLNA